MIRRSTVVYITVLLALVAGYYALKNRPQSQEDLPTPEPVGEAEYLFTAEEGLPTSIRIQARTGEVVEIARNTENAWALFRPIEAQADQGSSEAAASQVTTMRILDRAPQIDAGLVGLAEPEYVLTVRFNGGTERTVHLGVLTPSESGYYARDAAGGDVLIVSKSAVESLLRLLTSPPYLETPTPSPDPVLSETPLPGTAAIAPPTP